MKFERHYFMNSFGLDSAIISVIAAKALSLILNEKAQEICSLLLNRWIYLFSNLKDSGSSQSAA
jgi:hypothetical protein